jgi:molecular chaperone GrpE (heat shock protein)
MAEILDLRENIALTAEAAAGMKLPRRPWHTRTLLALDRLRVAQRMLTDKADDTLRRLNLVPVAGPGDTFDPACMRANTVSITGAAAGTVISVIRQGYRREGRIIRVAEVEVEKET